MESFSLCLPGERAVGLGCPVIPLANVASEVAMCLQGLALSASCRLEPLETPVVLLGVGGALQCL